MNREYFIVRPDHDLRYVIQPLNLPDAKDLKELDEYAPFFVARQDVQEYSDYLEKQPYPRNTCRLVSDKMKRILEKYNMARQCNGKIQNNGGILQQSSREDLREVLK